MRRGKVLFENRIFSNSATRLFLGIVLPKKDSIPLSISEAFTTEYENVSNSGEKSKYLICEGLKLSRIPYLPNS